MRTRDTFDVFCSAAAVIVDAIAVFGGFMLAYYIRFNTDLIPVTKGYPPATMYLYGSALATLLYLFVFRTLGLYQRPQLGSFGDKIPRIVRACLVSLLIAVAMASFIRTEHEFARWVIAISLVTVTTFVLLERYILFRIEYNLALLKKAENRIVILGTNEVAAHLQRALRREPRLRSEVVAFLRVNGKDDEATPAEMIKGGVADLEKYITDHEVDQVIIADPSLPHERMVELILLCEKNLVDFSLVPDLFRVLTSSVTVQNIDGVPLVGVGKWPLDFFWHRIMKRTEDTIGGAIGLVIGAPLIAISALIIKATSNGPVFYAQERCGEKGKSFMLYKLRTMNVDAEEESGPVWASEDDPRRTKVGAFLRRTNLDELPQFWNVLKGDMSLVGPRPERPHFVEQFRGEMEKYMWRHVSKPGLTGWAQVNGLRGNTSIHERIKYDLYYLENWSLAFDFKILVKTFFSRQNAY